KEPIAIEFPYILHTGNRFCGLENRFRRCVRWAAIALRRRVQIDTCESQVMRLCPSCRVYRRSRLRRVPKILMRGGTAPRPPRVPARSGLLEHGLVGNRAIDARKMWL